ncbi:MAG: LCP family protein [Acidobacteriota bacterium]|nr:LCP family protein [Acidobacteriota bacterium]
MPRTQWGVAWRGLLAFVLIVGCAAGATATAGLLKFKSIADVINIQKALASKELTVPPPGAPQTLLLVGVDHRYHEGSTPGNTDTMMLVRVNDRSSTINMLSIPRDIQVDVPGYGAEKINAAYSEGGPDLLIKTLKADVFPSLKVNQLLLVDFSSFANLINAIGCVYAQVDHRYYNHSIGLANPTTDYSSIDIQPGYQKLCGGHGSNLGGATTALAFVRFRHNDSDFVRESRQQDFLRWAKQNFSVDTLLTNQNTLLHDFAKDVQSDKTLHSTTGLIGLFDLAIHADGSATKSFVFPYGTSIAGTSNVSFSEAQSEATFRRFMRPTVAAPANATTTTTTATTATPPPTGKHRGRKLKARFQLPAYMAPDTADGNSQAAHLGNPGLPVYYPKDIPTDYSYCFAVTGDCNIGYEPSSAYANSYPRRYSIDATDGKRYPAYVMTLLKSYGGVTETGTGAYATVEGTTWPGAGHAEGPPLLRSPTSTKDVNGKLLYLYSQGSHLATVAWKTSSAVYWISNTIQNDIPNVQMVAMAASFTRAS